MTGNTLVIHESASALHATEHEESHYNLHVLIVHRKHLLLYLRVLTVHNLLKQLLVGMSQLLHHCLALEYFYPKTCTIPLVRCDFEQIKKTVELQMTQNKSELMASDQKPEEDTGNNASKNIAGTSGPNDEPNQIEICTSTRKRTIIDYKKFLEEYADEPPLPPKKKREVDLKRKPSKSRMAAEKYSRSKFFTKPTHLPRPVRR